MQAVKFKSLIFTYKEQKTMAKTLSPIRRAELISPFGPGAMLITSTGMGVTTAGLDHWFEREDGVNDSIDLEEYKVYEWRLQQLLQVDHFRLPPDYRTNRMGNKTPNIELTIPFLRFPCWHFCPYCNLLVEISLTSRDRHLCSQCNDANNERRKTNKVYVRQVPFIAMCDQGHLQDFPWREWVHKTANPSCDQKIRLIATGGASLEGQLVKCDCGLYRSLSSITTATADNSATYLSSNLNSDGTIYSCRGKRPWLGLAEGEPCHRPIRGSLRSAANVYFARVRSAIYLPRGNDIAPSELISELEVTPLSTNIDLLKKVFGEVSPQQLRTVQPDRLRKYSDSQIAAALHIMQSSQTVTTTVDEDPETSFRRAEFNVLREGLGEPVLKATSIAPNNYGAVISQHFSRITLVEKLRETRVLQGFNRIYSETGQDNDAYKRLLWQNPPVAGTSWLPAYLVHGEGIFLELDEQKLKTWEQQYGKNLDKRLQSLIIQYKKLQDNRHLRERPLGARLVLLHTLSHLIMNELTFECGYSSAALRERLYISNNDQAPMAAVLIYTAAGDAEGTLGGLVRMGKPGNLEQILSKALYSAQWCSSDPICMELGTRGGQGPESCNLAACHNCTLVPETACEEFNRFLDRGVVIGDQETPSIGFFESFLVRNRLL
jgi:hypothetical protein